MFKYIANIITCMKFLITGASGFLGYHLCKYLASKGEEVAGIDINDFEYEELKGKVQFYKGDVRDKLLIEKITKDVDVIIHGAAALPLSSKEEIYSVNLGGTKNILDSALKNGVNRVIYISSTAVYGIPKTHPVTEEYPLVGVGPYGETKIKSEQLCREYRKKGLCVPIIRPKTFAGPYRLGVFQVLCDWVASKKNIPIIGNGKNKYQLLHIYDLVEALYIMAKADCKKVNDVFNIGALEFKSMKEDLQELLDYAGYGKKVIPIPSILVVPPLKLFDKLHISPLYEWVYETADVDHYVDISKIMKTLNWKPKYTTADVWIDTYKWYVENKDKIKKTGKTHRVAWKQGILELAKVVF